MADTNKQYLSKIVLGGKTYDLKDAEARALIASLEESVSGIHQFTYQVVDALPTASKETMHIIYLVNDNGKGNNNYEEYITLQDGDTFKWEKLGDIALDLSGYVVSLSKEYADVVTSVSGERFTPEGTVELARTAKTINFDITASGTARCTAEGTISDQTVSVIPATESIAHLSVDDGGAVATKAPDAFDAGRLPSKSADTFKAGKLPSLSGTVTQADSNTDKAVKEAFVASVDEGSETLTLTPAAQIDVVTSVGAVTHDIKFDAGELPEFTEGTFDAGELPEFTEGEFNGGKMPTFTTTTKTVVTGIDSASVSKAIFTGIETEHEVSVAGDKSIEIDTVDSATFTGTTGDVNVQFGTNQVVKEVTAEYND